MDQLILKRFNGTEIFAVESTEFTHDEEGYSFQVDCKAGLLSAPLEDSGTDRSPRLEITFPVENGAPMDVDDVMELTEDEDEIGEYTNFYYYSHQPLFDVCVHILEKTESAYRVEITAKTQDVNYYDGSKPDAEITVQASFPRTHQGLDTD